MAKSKKRQAPSSVNKTKRDHFKWAMQWVGTLLTGATGSVIGNKITDRLDKPKPEGQIDSQWSRSTEPSVAHHRLDLIERLLLDINQSTDFIPPTNWKVMPPNVDTGGGVFTYEHEATVLGAMRGFFRDVDWRIALGVDRNVQFNHSLVFLGSGVSNSATREYLGDADAPRFEVAIPKHGVIRLPYAIAYVSSRQVERLQYSLLRAGPESAFIDSSRNPLARPRTGPTNELLEDYLLVTKIPGRIFFTGLHGLGTRATELFFRSDPTMLEHLEASLRPSKGESVYFQAIFRATDLVERNGSWVATKLECMRNPCPPLRVL